MVDFLSVIGALVASLVILLVHGLVFYFIIDSFNEKDGRVWMLWLWQIGAWLILAFQLYTGFGG